MEIRVVEMALWVKDQVYESLSALGPEFLRHYDYADSYGSMACCRYEALCHSKTFVFGGLINVRGIMCKSMGRWKLVIGNGHQVLETGAG
jgi:hypothetical protein